MTKKDRIPRYGLNEYDKDNVIQRSEWVANKTNTKISHLNDFSIDPNECKGNTESIIGTAQVPVGIAGPILVNGKYAKGNFYVPLATTEGVLVNAYTRGMLAISKAGGADVIIHEDEIPTSPIFIFDSLFKSQEFVEWVKNNIPAIIEVAESTTKYGKLKRITPRIIGNKVILTFYYFTADAMGLNMINIATREAARYILDKFPVKKYYLRSNYSADKKAAFSNLNRTYGKNVSASILLPRKIIKRYLNSTPEEMFDWYQTVAVCSTYSGMIGINGQFANALAAIFIACGQDVASIVNSSIGLITCEITEDGDLYGSINIPNLVIGTVGGGTSLPTQKECLNILKCDGKDSAKKFAEIIAATLLAGEASLGSAFSKDDYMDAHKDTRNK